MALNFEQPDRVPVFATYVPEVERQLRAEMCIDEFDLGTALGLSLIHI